MQLESTFSVVAPIGKAWDTLMDFERVAGCLPGAEVLAKLSDDAYKVGMKVKLGPVTLQYKGQLNVIERDAAEHRAVLQGRAQETRGQGTAQATVTLRLSETGGSTTGAVSADLALSGKAAAMGKGIIGSVTDQMMALFAANLQAMVAEPASAPAQPGGEAAAAQPHDRANAEPPVAAAEPPGAAPAPPPAPEQSREAPPDTAAPGPLAPPAPPAGSSLNGLALAKDVIGQRLRSPAVYLGLLVAVAFIAFQLGRNAARSRRRRPAGKRG
ncbi:carbon monoxide dehydrogenase [Arthrobacter sp. Soil736]|uniref:SRPBCC family protein n=1 Tax=Arthrobacter sp. Soil736 TaxID=1736395 RepID=UPI0006F9B536|nr:SRPBCC family protein [Arthrobacter sp. Soil736]KRE63900.1 carbon monoxide dehydrogenase [Arthrobacter sp. Soil736]